MNTTQVMAEYARLGQLHDALALMVALNVITSEQRIEYTRKFMDDRPEFKEAVAKAMGGTVINPASTNTTKEK